MLNIHIIHLTMYIRNYLKDSDISSEQIEKIGKSSEIFISEVIQKINLKALRY